MPAPMKSLRPKKRPNRRLGPDDEGSTRSPDGLNMAERAARDKKMDKKAYGGKMEKVKKMASGGNVCRGMGAAKRGGNFVVG